MPRKRRTQKRQYGPSIHPYATNGFHSSFKLQPVAFHQPVCAPMFPIHFGYWPCQFMPGFQWGHYAPRPISHMAAFNGFTNNVLPSEAVVQPEKNHPTYGDAAGDVIESSVGNLASYNEETDEDFQDENAHASGVQCSEQTDQDSDNENHQEIGVESSDETYQDPEYENDHQSGVESSEEQVQDYVHVHDYGDESCDLVESSEDDDLESINSDEECDDASVPSEQKCSICLDKMKKPVKCFRCTNISCWLCWDEWLKWKGECPICGLDIDILVEPA